MIWTSHFLMTVIDLLILVVVGYALVVFNGTRKRLTKAGARLGFAGIVAGLCLVGLFYLIDLLLMHVATLFVPMATANALMQDLHLNYRWLASLIGVGSIALGLVAASRGTLALVGDLERSQADLQEELRLHRETERVRQKNERRLVGILDIATEAIVSIDKDHRIILFNQGAEETFGYRAEDILGRSIDVLLPRDVVAAHHAALVRFGTEDNDSRLMSERGEIRAVRKDGTEFPAKASISRLELDGELVFTAILRDISTYKKTEEALEWQRTLVGTLMEAWPDLIFVKDRKSRFLVANAKTAAVMGAATPEELIGRTDLDYYPTDVAEDFMASEQAMMESGEVVTAREETLADPQGKRVWLSTTKVPLMKDGEVVGLVGINRDVTVRKQEERALGVAKKEAEVASRAKSEFLANMSHELRTPLNAIIGFSEIIAEQTMGPLGDDRYCGYGQDINGAGHHLLDLINDILDLSKVESGKDELNEELVDVEAVAETVSRLLKIRAASAEVTLITDVQDEIPPLCADERKLKQILANLLSNSVKFTEAGGQVTLRVSCEPGRGHVFEVRDTGIGIAQEDIPKALSLFGQVDSQFYRRQEGTGLGLPLTMALVELHDGSFELKSEVGVGTTATVRFPAGRIVAASGETLSDEPSRSTLT